MTTTANPFFMESAEIAEMLSLIAGTEVTPVDGGFRVKETDAHYVDVLRMIFNWRVARSPRDYPEEYDRHWCFAGTGWATLVRAVRAAAEWDVGDRSDPRGLEQERADGRVEGIVKTRIIEAVQSKDQPGNWGKFLVGTFDEEWAYDTRVDPGGGPLLRACGWWGPERLWVLDLQTGEGAYFGPGGYAHADLDKHRVWVCVLYEPFLEWLYERHRESGGRLDLDGLPDVVELPDAPFAFQGYRRPGPEGAR